MPRAKNLAFKPGIELPRLSNRGAHGEQNKICYHEQKTWLSSQELNCHGFQTVAIMG